MTTPILGLHHITAIAGDAQRNLSFYTKTMGLRLVKKTVNFDDPGTYHFYYGNETGAPGTILTFFPWTHVKPGLAGTGMATDIGYSVPVGGLEFWSRHLEQAGVRILETASVFGERYLSFADPDGLRIRIIETERTDSRTAWKQDQIPEEFALKGFDGIILTLRDFKPTASILTDIFGYRLLDQEKNSRRFVTDAVSAANLVDILETPNGHHGIVAGGTNHHVAFRVPDEATLMMYREKVLAAGLDITPKIDRNYFYSLYFREPGGVLFEIATDNPGFMADETQEELGRNLKLPAQYEQHRAQLEKQLPSLVY